MGKVAIPPNLIPMVAAGDQNAFEELYRLTYRPLFSFLVSLTSNQEDASDLLQETYLKVYTSASRYTERGNSLAWIMKIGKNLFLMQQRSRKNDFVYLDDRDSGAAEIPFDNIADSETRTVIQEMFDALSREERTIVVLHEISGFKHKEIADLLELPLGTVLSKYNRAINKLRSQADLTENGDANDK